MRNALLFIAAALLTLPSYGDCITPPWVAFDPITADVSDIVPVDLNGDGRPDIVGYTSTAILVSLNDGTGGLRPPVQVYVGTVDTRPEMGDFNGDSRTDVAFAQGAAIVVLPGHGDGTFGSVVTNPTAAAIRFIQSAHFDHGSTLDVAVVDTTPSFVLYTNDGTGMLREQTRMPLSPDALSLAAGDLDADGLMDVIVTFDASEDFDALYGRGDGTFDRGVIRGGRYIENVRIVDLTGDGLCELVTGAPGSLITTKNLGARVFGDPLYFPLQYGFGAKAEVADLTGDTIPDVLIDSMIVRSDVFTGTGLGTFRYQSLFAPEYAFVTTTEVSMALSDVDVDGRADAVVVMRDEVPSRSTLTIYRNVCGDSNTSLSTEAPLISIGQTATLTAVVSPPAKSSPASPTSGTITLRDGDTLLDTASLSRTSTNNTTALLTASGLALGDHSLTATYNGNVQFEPSTSNPVMIRVTTMTTTTSIAVSPTQGEYGIAPTITARVTSSDGTTPTGPVRFSADAQPPTTLAAPSATFRAGFAVGTHTYSVQFAGDATHPPSAASTSYVIGKQVPQLSMQPVSSGAGQNSTVEVRVISRGNGAYPSGTLTLSDGTRSYGTQTLDSIGGASFSLPAMSAGRQQLRITYSGDEHYTGAETTVMFVVFASPGAIDARGDESSVRVSWYDPSGSYMRMVRKLPWRAWGTSDHVEFSSYSPIYDSNALPETVYQYRMESWDRTLISPVDLGMRISFTDDPVSSGTTVKAVHLQEIVRATNIVRAAARLAPIASDVAPGSVITAAQVNALRNAIQEARSTLGAAPFPFAEAIFPGTPVRAVHIQELREAVR